MPNASTHTKKINNLDGIVGLVGDKFYYFYWGSWILIRVSRFWGFPIPFLNNWLTDFVYVPIVLHFTIICGNLFIQPKRATCFSLCYILLICAFVALIFEGLMPTITDFYVYDFWDVMMYFAGGVFFYKYHQPLITTNIQHLLNNK